MMTVCDECGGRVSNKGEDVYLHMCSSAGMALHEIFILAKKLVFWKEEAYDRH